MKLAVCLLVGVDARARAASQNVVRQKFPGTILKDFGTLEEALKSEPAADGELLVLANPDDASLTKAIEANDRAGLRRWAIVVLGSTPVLKGIEVVPSKERDEHLLTRAFRSAIAQYHLIRENERARGDLRALAYRISHDLRTPLGGVLSAGEVLKEIVMEQDSSNAALVKPLFDSADDLDKLISRVSALMKASANPVAKQPVAMGEVVWATLQRQERQIIRKNAVVTQPDSWPEVEAVSSWLEAVWGNLLSNALQHGKASPRIQLGWRQEDQVFRFWVSDDGDGVSPEKIANLFQPFHLLYRPDARKGLGLSIVQRLVELQGGRCGYEPDVNGGSCFYFTLPLSENVAVSASKKKQQIEP